MVFLFNLVKNIYDTVMKEVKSALLLTINWISPVNSVYNHFAFIINTNLCVKRKVDD